MKYKSIHTSWVLLILILSVFQVSGQDNMLSRLIPDGEAHLLAPGLISTLQGEYSPTYDVIHNELVFMRRTPGIFDYTLYSSQLTDDGWTAPAVLPFSGDHRDAGPYLSPDGMTLFFDSRRPSDKVADYTINLWYSQRRSGGWDEPLLLENLSRNDPDEPKAGLEEYGPAVDGKGKLYFYSFRRPFRGGARYLSTPPDYTDVSVDRYIPDPSAQTFISYLYIYPDGQTAIMEGQAVGRRDTDLYCSCRQANGQWSTPSPLTAVNTVYGEGGPFVTADGQYLFFTSTRPAKNTQAGDASLYAVRIDSSALPCR